MTAYADPMSASGPAEPHAPDDLRTLTAAYMSAVRARLAGIEDPVARERAARLFTDQLLPEVARTVKDVRSAAVGELRQRRTHRNHPHRFRGPYNSITFHDNDVRAPLPRAQPGLDRLLVRHAEPTLAAARPAPLRQDLFRMALDCAFREDAISLEHVAQRLAVSPRALRRRLGEHGTTRREEVESVRQEHTLELLRTTDLPLRSVAARVGFSDARALRRAGRRWEGRPPRYVRSTAGAGTGTGEPPATSWGTGSSPRACRP
ncbi:helix-turn-helix domain-containing protein [Streptomyces sp. NPDC085639]|uniref:helix-turn-helix transcriptional regulator n=1 Tax=Streptomyces sp. NPDC085639 TaxID=3365734 RepID=UPI0037CCFC1B